MANPSIGGNAFITLSRSKKEEPGRKFEIITRVGVSFIRARRGGKTPKPFVLVGFRDFLDVASLEAAVTTYKTMQDNLQSIVPEVGTAMNNVLILDVEEIKRQFTPISTNGLVTNSKYLLWVQFTVQPTE